MYPVKVQIIVFFLAKYWFHAKVRYNLLRVLKHSGSELHNFLAGVGQTNQTSSRSGDCGLRLKTAGQGVFYLKSLLNGTIYLYIDCELNSLSS